MTSKNLYEAIDEHNPTETVRYIYYGILDVLQLSTDDGQDWVETPEIISCIGENYGNHIHTMLDVMLLDSVIIAKSVKRMSDGRRVKLWSLPPEIPF